MIPMLKTHRAYALALFMLTACSGGRHLPDPYPLGQEYFSYTPSANCDCDLIIDQDVSSVDASDLSPGSELCFNAQLNPSRGPIRFENLKGTRENPIIIRNCMGRVNLISNDHRPALYAEGEYFRITGKGQNESFIGLEFQASQAAQAIAIGKSSYLEIDHIHISASQFAGIMAKVDPSTDYCKTGDRRFDSFIMKHVHIHHNTIENTGGEGIYVGNSFYGGTTSQYCLSNPHCGSWICGNIQFPHEVMDVYIWNNTINETAWDGVQVGSTIHNCFIHNNSISHWGQANASGQNYGVQAGQGSSCQVSYNTLINGKTGLHISGLGNTVVENNQLLNFSGNGILVNPYPSPLSRDIADQGFLGGFTLRNNVLTSDTTSLPVIRDVRRENLSPPNNNSIHHNTIDSSAESFQLSSEYNWELYDNVIH
ncbi:MAG TPA: right-handed parallel beta-helix repeat-containing protein [Oligoflexia bacterium]|nr:right-handed parallel beta-helix repeat-containing protein [Oligoflexia bacterium]